MAIRPLILNAGDTIGVVTLGSPLDASVINARIQVLKDMGFKVVVGRNTYKWSNYLAGSDEERAADLMSMFLDKRVKAIIPSRGGTGVKGILPYLDYNIIRQNPKIITGYSDVTILLNALYQFSELITFHSLLLIDFRYDSPAYNFNQFFTATSTLVSPRVINNPEGIPLISRVPGNVTGPLVGGNLTSFIGTLGTPYEIDTTNKIFFLEETHEPINTVYRYLSQLKLAGKFQASSGIIVGECTGCEASYGQTYVDLVTSFFLPLGKPLMTNLTTGHGYYKAALPIGAVTNLNTVEYKLTVLEPTVTLG